MRVAMNLKKEKAQKIKALVEASKSNHQVIHKSDFHSIFFKGTISFSTSK